MGNKILVTKPFLPKREVFDKYVDKIFESDWLTNNGPLVQEFQDKLCKFMGANCVNAVVNGHLALEIALKGLEIEGEVITTPFTFVSTTHAISRCGLKPVFCDIKWSDLTIDENKIEPLITEKTCAIMPVHVYGHPCNVERIEAIAKKYNLKVIFDAAHAFGVSVNNGRCLCTYGDVSMISLHATKLINSIEGGLLVYNNKEYTKIFNTLKNFGIEGEEKIDYIGGNAKMNEFQAAMGLSNLGYFNDIVKRREEITLKYRTLLDEIPGIRYFKPDAMPGVKYNFGYLPILVDDTVYGINRDRLYDVLKEHDVYARKYFYPIVPDMGCYKQLKADVPIAEKAGEQVLCLPIYYTLTDKEIEYVCKIIKESRK